MSLSDLDTGHEDLKNYDSEAIQTLAEQIESILVEEGWVSNHELMHKHGLSSNRYTEGSLKWRVLPNIRDVAAEQDLVQVREVEPSRGGGVKKEWRLQNNVHDTNECDTNE